MIRKIVKLGLFVSLLLPVVVSAADTITLTGTIRDFYDYNQNNSKNPDFENPNYPPPSGYGSYAVTGLVKDRLDQDRKPVLRSNTGQMHDKQHRSITDANSFSQWYRDVVGINMSMPYSITLTKNGDVYEYENHNFFPIDDELIGNEGGIAGIKYWGHDHNYHFTYEIHSKFTYKGGETFTFAGDDDVWVFINNELVIDIGGIHSSVEKSVDLDKLGLTKGETYNFDFFFAERHIVGSNFTITTSIELEDTSVAPFSMDVVSDYDTKGYTQGETIKVTNQPFALDAVLLDENSTPIAYHPKKSQNPIPMTVLFFAKKEGTSDTPTRIENTYALFTGGKLHAKSNDISSDTLNEGKYDVKVKYLDFYDNTKVNLQNCSGSGLNSTLKGIPACVNGENNYRAMFGDEATEKCFSKGNHGSQEDLPCSSGYGSSDVKEPYNHEYGCYECTIDALWGDSPKDTSAKVIKENYSTPFTCSSESFISFNTSENGPTDGESQFDTINLSDGSLKQHNILTGADGVNSIGYNIKDNFIWGYNLATNKLVRIDAKHNAKLYDLPDGLPEDFYIAADVDKNGILYLASRDSDKIQRVNVDSTSSDFLKALEPLKLKESNSFWMNFFGDDTTISTADFAFNPIDNQLYFIQEDSGGKVYKIDPNTGLVSFVVESGVDPYVVISFFDKDGNFYFNLGTGEDTRKLYKIDMNNPHTATYFTQLDKGLTNGDGARCPNAKVEEPNSPNGLLLTRGDNNNNDKTNVYVFSVDTKTDEVKNLHLLKKLDKKFRSLAYKDGKYYTSDMGGQLYTIDIDTGDYKKIDIQIDSRGIMALDFDGDGNILYEIWNSNTDEMKKIRKYNLDTKTSSVDISLPDADKYANYAIAYEGNGKYVTSVEAGGVRYIDNSDLSTRIQENQYCVYGAEYIDENKTYFVNAEKGKGDLSFYKLVNGTWESFFNYGEKTGGLKGEAIAVEHDRAKPAPQDPQEAFSCEENAYMFTSIDDWLTDDAGKLSLVDFEKKSIDVLKERVGKAHINAAGYSVYDDFIYAIEGKYEKEHSIVKIDKNYNVIKRIQLPSAYNKEIFADGDVQDGIFYFGWLINSGNLNKHEIYRYDIKNNQFLNPLKIAFEGKLVISDFAFNIKDKKLYGVDGISHQLVRINLDKNKIDYLGKINFIDNVSKDADNTVISFFDKDGYFYFSQKNDNGLDIYKLYIGDGSSINTDASYYQKFKNDDTSGDGARCAEAAMRPDISIDDNLTITEGDSGTKELSITIKLDRPAIKDVTFTYKTTDGLAKDTKDYIGISGQGHIAKGDKETILKVQIIGDTSPEQDEDFVIQLSNIFGAHSAQDTIYGICKIIDNDYTKFDAYTKKIGANNKITTQIVGNDINLNIIKLQSDNILQFNILSNDDVNETKAKLIDIANGESCHTGEIAKLIDDSDYISFLGNTLHFPAPSKASKEMQVQFYWYDKQKKVYRTSCSSDTFAIRPDHYLLNITPIAPDTSLKAGKDFNITIEAIGAGISGLVTNYEENADVYALEYNDTKTGSSNCKLGNLTMTPVKFTGGKASFSANYDDVGKLDLKVHEILGKEYAKVDAVDTPNVSARLISTASKSTGSIEPSTFEIQWDFTNGGTQYTYFSDDPIEMGANLDINITATKEDGTMAKNFSNGCYSDDLTIKAIYQGDPDITYNPTIKASWKDNSTIKHLANLPTQIKSDDHFTYKLEKSLFTNGKGSKHIKINFDRDTTTPKNPMLFTINDINATFGSKSYTSNTHNKTLTFIYARAYAPDQQVVGDEIVAKIYYEVYCKECNKPKFGFENYKEGVDSIDWLILPSIDAKLDYELTSDASGPAAPSYAPGTITANYKNGIKFMNKQSRALKIESEKTPLITKVKYVPKSYLKFNLFNPNPPTQSFSLNFSKAPKKWAGKGSQGATVDLNISSTAGYRKIDW